jgi:periplasmic protein TonB
MESRTQCISNTLRRNCSHSFIFKTDFMKPDDMLHADMLDILFENRNKSYGAYPLRKFYNQRLLISFGAMCSLVMLFTALCFYFQSSPFVLRPPQGPDVHLVDILPPSPKPILPPAVPNVPRPPATIQSTPPLIVPDPLAPTPIATVEEIRPAVIGLTTTPGDPDNNVPNSSGNARTGTGTIITDSTESRKEVLDFAEIMPEFPGGLEGLKRFLVKNLRMPENDLEPNAQVRVIARFVVGADGSVRDIEITHPEAEPFNREVNRVISKMPDWKPGMQNHRHVAVYFSLPVNFVNGGE